MIWLLQFLPKNHISYLVGIIVSIPFPKAVSSFLIYQFAQYYKINLEEAEKHYSEYESIGDFFVRKLKPGVRPLGQGEVLHPADSEITQAALIHEGQLIQAKGKLYRQNEFLKEEVSDQGKDGLFITYYLCPTDYHRVHSPVDGEIIETAHIPGALWPVNKMSVESISDLFSINERVVTKIRTVRGVVSLVFVGATNVGKIELSYDSEIVSNDLIHREVRRRIYSKPIPIQRGQELGLFRMGSTVVMIYPSTYRGVLDQSLLSSLQGQKVKVNSDLR